MWASVGIGIGSYFVVLLVWRGMMPLIREARIEAIQSITLHITPIAIVERAVIEVLFLGLVFAPILLPLGIGAACEWTQLRRG